MGTEVDITFSSLRAQLESEKNSLSKIDENIKKIVQTTGRFNNDRFNNSGDYNRGNNRFGGRNSFPDTGNNHKNEDIISKRKNETKTVFSRLSARVDSDGEDEPSIKRNRMSSTVSRELPSKAAVLRAQGLQDEQARSRNRRFFGSLLGTLQKFKQEEIVLQTKEDKKAQVEKKIEEQARLEKEKEQQERKTLFAEREYKKATIKALEAKMARVQEFEKWEESQQYLNNFILTKAKPYIYWIPKKMSDMANEKLISSRKYHEECMERKRQELQEELLRIEHHCLRPKGPNAKENDPAIRTKEELHSNIKNEEDKGIKRDKFAMDVDQKEDEESDTEERHDDNNKNEDVNVKEEDELAATKASTNEPNKSEKIAEILDSTIITSGETKESSTENQVNNTAVDKDANESDHS